MVGEDRLELMVWVVDAMLAVVPKGLGFVGVGVPKGPEELGGGYMWGCSGRLGRMVTGWDMSKSSEVVAEADTEFVVAGLAAGCCGYS